MTMARDFNFHVGGIEAGMIQALAALEYAGAADYYRDELDDDELERESGRALTRLAGRTPLFLASYVDGSFQEPEGHPWFAGEKRLLRHDATFVALACAPDWPGDTPEQIEATTGVGARRMVSDAIGLLAGRTFKAVDAETDEEVFLNLDPIRLSEGRNPTLVLRRDEVTIYAVYFDTYFEFEVAPPAESEPVIVEAINFAISPLNGVAGPGGLPGVHFKP